MAIAVMWFRPQWMRTLQDNPELTTNVSGDADASAAVVHEENDVEAEMLAAAIAASLEGNG